MTATVGVQPTPADSTTRAGHARITFQQVRPGVYNITTQQGVLRVDGWSCSYGDPDVAVAELARTVAAFTEWGTDTALAAEYDRLTTAIHAAEQRHLSTGKLQTRREAVQPLTGAARDRELRERWTASRDLMLAVADLPLAERIDAIEAARDSFDATHPQV